MALLRATGLFSEQEIDVNGTMIRPIDFSSKLLFPMWKMKPGEVDFPILQVIVEGKKDGKSRRYIYDLFDKYDPATDTQSMARTTGYTATMAIRMLAADLYDRKGRSPPEFMGQDVACVAFMLKGLEERGVRYHLKMEEIE